MTRDRSTRRGVTLIEVMVAMALTLVIMLILAEAFKSSLDFVRSANSTGNMMSQLNGAGTVLARDIKADHFLYEDGKPNGGVKLSDQRLDWKGGTGTKKWDPPRAGFFRIKAPQPPPQNQHGSDQEGFQIITAEDHVLHFTSILPGGSAQDVFAVRVGGTEYSSKAAEVAYFLSPTGVKTDPGPNGRNLYNLIRRYRLVAPTGNDVGLLTSALADPTHADVISVPNPNPGNTVNTLDTVKTPANRLPLAAFPVANARYGEDLLLSNVLSFEVRAEWTPNTTPPYAMTSPRQFTTSGVLNNTESPYDYLPGLGEFDTGTNPPPMYARIKSLRVTIRVWDPRMKQARQNTWEFDL